MAHCSCSARFGSSTNLFLVPSSGSILLCLARFRLLGRSPNQRKSAFSWNAKVCDKRFVRRGEVES